ncbi:hypothetical protein, partial [Comamonas kerstersii]|uniref:hypothetical protein n=1 Tax=Comamonas kerstersii TaxID=225992 RepID=UPI00266FCA98
AYRLYLVKDALKINFFKFCSLRSAKPCIVALFFSACKKNLKFSFCVADCVLRSAKTCIVHHFWCFAEISAKTFSAIGSKKLLCTSNGANYSTVLALFQKKAFQPQPSRWLRLRQRTALPWIMQSPWH